MSDENPDEIRLYSMVLMQFPIFSFPVYLSETRRCILTSDSTGINSSQFDTSGRHLSEYMTTAASTSKKQGIDKIDAPNGA